ncbi:TetR/AcrR family transcriptional regulator [Chryseolinea sp. T2]|uniref:TetR/AcrR family transcriptional regulator n=1 Tax=Chryseolinea sp. T2 TaxID=3129255 RepID=UPI003078052F
MAIANRKERQKEELKASILEAARTLFIERGYEETSIRNIAERIEYSPTTIYLYFKDKDDIFYALHREGFVLLNQYFRSLQEVEDPFERLKAITKAYIRFALENREYYDLMFISRSPMSALEDSDNEKWEEGDRAFAALTTTIHQCLERGYFKGMDPQVLSFTCWSMVHGICALEIRGRCKVVPDELLDGLSNRVGMMIVDMLERMHGKKPV